MSSERIQFKLVKEFVNGYRTKQPPFGFNGLGELTYMRTYSRIKENGENEKWFETIERVVNGTYSVQKRHILKHDLGWNEDKAQASAQEMYDLMFNMKFLPPGRGLWAMGTDIIEEKELGAALNNCAFVSTENIDKELTKPFEFLMDMSMLGVGVGFDVKGAGKITIYKPHETLTQHVIEDSREGWVKSIKHLLLSYWQEDRYELEFDYSQIRKKGEIIKTFGGKASGPEPLEYLHNQIRTMFKDRQNQTITVTDIVDIMNMIGCCVVAGNVRRTAEIVVGSPYDEEYLKLKDYRWNGKEMEGSMKHRAAYGWSSNNSILAELGMDYTNVGNQTGLNGEPGYVYLENMQKYGRMIDPINWKDKKVKGPNPCTEQSLESMELCCLVETFPTMCKDLPDYLRALKFAYMYAKTVTLIKTHWSDTNRVMLRNRRIGTSMSGIQMFISEHGLDVFRQWCEEGYVEIQKYDTLYSDWFCVPKSIKTTSVKPSGTVSLLPGVTPGMHWPEDNYYIRRITIAKNSDLVQKCIDAGYKVEDAHGDPYSVKVEVPIEILNIRTVDQVSMWEQVSMAAFLQKYWADNQVSCTVTFKPGLTEEEEVDLLALTEKLYNPLLPTIKIEPSEIDDDTIQGLKEIMEKHQGEMVVLEGKPDEVMTLDNTKFFDDLKRYEKLIKKKAQSEAHQIKDTLNYFQYQLKGISFLPKFEGGAFPQMPYEGISKERYEEKMRSIKSLNFIGVSEESIPEQFCDGDKCEIN